VTSNTVQPNSTMDEKGRRDDNPREGGMTPRKLNNSLLFSRSISLDPFLYLSFFSAVGKEAGRWWEIMWEDVGCAGPTTIFITLLSSNRGGKMAGLHRRGKKPQ
jgi:hypothetical protein